MTPEKITSLTKPELAALVKALPTMSIVEKLELFADLEVRERRVTLQAAQSNMLGFAHAVYPGFKTGPHHRKLAKIFTDVMQEAAARGTDQIKKREGELVSEFKKKGINMIDVNKDDFRARIVKAVDMASMGYDKKDWDRIQAIK